MTEFIAMQPEEIFSPPVDMENWYVQPKFDGHRVIIDYRGDEPKFLNRKGSPYSARRFHLEVPERLKGKVVDGEFVWYPHGTRTDGAYYLFDTLVSFNADYTNEPLRLRRTAAQCLAYIDNPFLFVGPLHIRGAFELDERVQEWRGWDWIDGVVFKRIDSRYTPGRTRQWLKMKFVSDIDCVISDTNIDGKANAELSVWDPLSEQWFPIGKASTNGKKTKKGDVVRVRFLKFTDGGRLREPRIIDVRDDKDRSECDVAQLIPHMNFGELNEGS